MTYLTALIDDDAEWDELARTSPQGSLFCESRYLRAVGLRCERIAAKSASGELLAGALVPIKDGKAFRGAYPFCPYQGILLSHRLAAQPAHKRHAQAFAITESLIAALCERHPSFTLALSPTFADLRPFLWHNYHVAGGAKFSVAQRYSAVLNLQDFDKDHYLASIRPSRRQEWRKSEAQIEHSTDIDRLAGLYRMTFERQGLAVPDTQIAMLANIAEQALQQSFGWLSAARLPGGDIASMTLFVDGGRTAYYLAAANHPDLRDSGASTHLMIENIAEAAARGCSQLDFVGVNSPNRGDFKLSFNPELMPYAEVSISAAEASA